MTGTPDKLRVAPPRERNNATLPDKPQSACNLDGDRESIKSLARRVLSQSCASKQTRNLDATYKLRCGAQTPPQSCVEVAPEKQSTRADLESMHPATIGGAPLAAILDQADPADFDALRDRATLEAFTRSLLATGTLAPVGGLLETKAEAPQAYEWVVCGDCQHFQPDILGDGAGIGQCAAGQQPRHPDPPLYPTAPRLCGEFQAREGRQ